EDDDVVRGRDMAATRREASSAAIADSPTFAPVAAPGAAVATVDASERISRVAGRESGGPSITRVGLLRLPLEEVGLVVSSFDQPGDRRLDTIDDAVDPLIELAWHLAETLIVDVLQQIRLRECGGPFIVSEVHHGIELVLSQGDRDVFVDR